MKRVLVTGSEGFVGRHFAKYHRGLGHEVVEVDIDAPPRSAAAMDALDFFRWSDDYFDIVFHCAALVGGRAKIDGDPMAIATNLALDSWAFRWALRTRPDQFVYFSSSAAYPTTFQNDEFYDTALSEGDLTTHVAVLEPDQTYGWAKLTGERLAQQAAEEGLRTYVFRPFSGYGPDQSLDYPFPSFIQRATRREDPFVVWGDGLQTRDFIHITDIVRAVELALAEDFRGPVNLCTGVGTSFLELAAMCLRMTGSSAAVECLKDKPVGVKHRVGDPTLLHTLYRPQVDIERGIGQALSLSRLVA